MTTENNTPTLEGVLSQLMCEAEWLSNDAIDMSENAEPHDTYDPDEEPEEMRVSYGELCDVRYKAKRVLVLLGKIREAFPEQTKDAGTWCALCGIHTDHDEAEHPALVAEQAAD